MSGNKRGIAAFALFFIVVCSASTASAFSQEITVMVNENATADIQQKISIDVSDETELNLLCENFWNFSISPDVEYLISGNEISMSLAEGITEFVLSYSADCILTKSEEKWNATIDFAEIENVKKIEIYLPRNSSITGFSPAASIKFQEPNLVITWRESNLTEEYVVAEYRREHSEDNSFWFFVAGFAVAFAAAFYLVRKKMPKRKSPNKDALKGLPESERKVIEIISGEEGISQKLLQEKADLPKATLSRIIHKLQEKGFIEVAQIGYTNKLYLGELLKKE